MYQLKAVVSCRRSCNFIKLPSRRKTTAVAPGRDASEFVEFHHSSLRKHQYRRAFLAKNVLNGKLDKDFHLGARAPIACAD